VYVVLVFNDMLQLQTNYWERSAASRASPKGQFDEMSKLFRPCSDSQRLNLQWFNKYNQVVQMLVQQQIRKHPAGGELSRIHRPDQQRISDMMRKSYEERQASQDRINRNFTEYVRGVETIATRTAARPWNYRAATKRLVQRPVPANTSSPTASLHPNVEARRNWTKLESGVAGDSRTC